MKDDLESGANSLPSILNQTLDNGLCMSRKKLIDFTKNSFCEFKYFKNNFYVLMLLNMITYLDI